MKSLRHLALGLVLVAPTGGYLGGYLESYPASDLLASQQRCLMSDTAAFRVLHGATHANYHVRFADADRPSSQGGPTAAALRIAIATTPIDADFTLVDDADHAERCPAGIPTTTIAVESQAARESALAISPAALSPANIVVALTTGADADYRVYVRSDRFTDRDGRGFCGDAQATPKP